MSSAADTSSPQALLWDAFRTDPSSGDIYHPDCHIVFMPTGAGAASEEFVRQFYKTGGYSHSRKLALEEKVIHRTIGESSAVDEVELTVKFVSGAGGWLLPGVEPHYLEDLVITFPLVICASFVEDRIASVRYLWDNASVLKMVKLIGSRHSWPIVTETQVDALRCPSRFRLNPFGNATAIVGSHAQKGISQIFSSPPTSPLPTTAAKGHPALTSTVFSQFKNAPLASHNGGGNNNGDHPQQRNTTPLSPSTSEESLASKAASPPHPNNEEERGAGWRPDYVKPKGHPAMTSTLFSFMKQPSTTEDDSSPTARRARTLSGGDNDGSATHGRTISPEPASKKGHPALTSTLFSHLKEQPSNRSSREEQQQQQNLRQEQEEERGAGWRPDYVKPKGHPAMTSSLFSQAPQTSPRPARQEQQQQQQQSPVEEERGAGWRPDYVKPKGHPAMTSSLFSHTAPTPAPPSRPNKRNTHNNIFGIPAEESSKAKAALVRQEVVEESYQYTLEPSAMETELERNEQLQHELKEADIRTLSLENIEKQIKEQEELSSEEEIKQAEAAMPPPAQAPLPTPPPARKIHPNYRTSFSIGGPR